MAEDAKKMKKKVVPKSRHFQLTLNQSERWPQLKSYLTSLHSLNYLIAGIENAPSTNHVHIHCYVQFKMPISLDLKKTEGSHVEICRGSPQQNKDYIEKGKIIDEVGVMRRSGNPTSIDDIKKMKKKEREKLSIVFYEKIKKLESDIQLAMDARSYKKNLTVFYYYGPSGVGKTNRAKDKIIELYDQKKIPNTLFHEVKHVNGFWIGADNDEDIKVAMYDDFRDSHMSPSEFINFIDYNIHNLNLKGRSIKNKYNYIIITSVQSPYELYIGHTRKIDSKEPEKQWLRRINEIIEIKEEEDIDLREDEEEKENEEIRENREDGNEDEISLNKIKIKTK